MDIMVTRARQIYTDGKHNAFTGICRHNERTYVCFRSGVDHVTPGSSIKVIASSDYENWSVVVDGLGDRALLGNYRPVLFQICLDHIFIYRDLVQAFMQRNKTDHAVGKRNANISHNC